jgi:hypothetical protein
MSTPTKSLAAVAGIVFAATLTMAGQAPVQTGPEAFSAEAKIPTDMGLASSTLTIQLNGYTKEPNRKVMADALRYNGFAGFWPVFIKAPIVGTVQIRDRKWNIRWATQQAEGERRRLLLATDKAIYFVGGASPNAKPRAGYDMAVLQFSVDQSGAGSGTIALAARVRPNADASAFILDDYSEPVDLTNVRKLSQKPK